MKTFAFLIFALSSTLAQGGELEAVIYRCSGNANEGDSSADIKVAVSKTRNKFWLTLERPNALKQRFIVYLAASGSDDVEIIQKFFNRKLEVQIEVFLDDIGSMSSITIGEEVFSLTCT